MAWLLSLIFNLAFAASLLIFHPLLVAAKFAGYETYKSATEILNGLILSLLRIVGTRYAINLSALPEAGSSVIIVSNHQSLFDITLIIWHLRRFHPKFISKRELGRGIPSVSHAVRNMGSLMIDRSNPREAVELIKGYAVKLSQTCHSPAIFPEGTRARDGRIKEFKQSGLIALLEGLPQAKVVPLVIDGSWELVRFKYWPLPLGTRITFKVLPALSREGISNSELAQQVEQLIGRELTNIRAEAADL
ncbi:MAG: 1-acyl-sn-glycerol-3-phosphate acyltransferase, partial [Proteobacteria bacterium]